MYCLYYNISVVVLIINNWKVRVCDMSGLTLDKLGFVRTGFDMSVFSDSKLNVSVSNIDNKIDSRPQEEIFKEWFDKGVEPHNVHSNHRMLKAYSEYYNSRC